MLLRQRYTRNSHSKASPADQTASSWPPWLRWPLALAGPGSAGDSAHPRSRELTEICIQINDLWCKVTWLLRESPCHKEEDNFQIRLKSFISWWQKKYKDQKINLFQYPTYTESWPILIPLSQMTSPKLLFHYNYYSPQSFPKYHMC